MRIFAALILFLPIITHSEAANPSLSRDNVLKMLEGNRGRINDEHVAIFCRDKSLTSLDLTIFRNSRITVDCLDHVVTLKKLKSLNLSNLKLGSIATFEKLKALPALEELILKNTENFNGKGPELLRSLRRLDISRERGKFGDTGFANLKGLDKLTHLNANQSRNWHGNKGMSYKGIKNLEHMTNLKSLALYGIFALKDEDYNKLFSKLTKLEYLEIGFNWPLKGTDLNLPNGLVSLDMRESWNLLDDSLVRMDKSNLNSLNLYDCHSLTDKTLISLKGLKTIKHLDVTGARALTDRGVQGLAGCDNLTHLSVSDSDDITDAGLARLGHMTQMKELNLWHLIGINGSGLSSLKNMNDIEVLTLSDCFGLTDEGLKHIKGKAKLKELYLDSCAKITDKGLANLSSLSNLTDLTLTACELISKDGLQHLRGLKALQYLNLAGCTGLSSADVRVLRRALPNCEIVL